MIQLGLSASENPHISAPRRNFQNPFDTFINAKFQLIGVKTEEGNLGLKMNGPKA